MNKDIKKRRIRNNTIRYIVAVPFLTNDYLFSITKRVGWSVIDYLFLKELSSREMTANELSEISNLKPKIVIQILLPMCKVGWIDIITFNESFVFRITELGKIAHKLAIKNHELPNNTKSYESRRDVFVDCFNNYYSEKDFFSPLITHERCLNEKNKSDRELIQLPIDFHNKYPNYEKMKNIITFEGEKVDSIHDQAVYTLSSTKYLLLDMLYVEGHKEAKVIEDKKIENLSRELVNLIKNTLPSTVEYAEFSSILGIKNREEMCEFNVVTNRNHVDFIYGGSETELRFLDLIKCSTDFLIIHSTFIGKWCILNEDGSYTIYFEELKKALKRGVQIYVLWGKSNASKLNEDSDASISKDKLIEKYLRDFNTSCNNEGLLNTINYNDFRRTDSHAKFIITKHETKGLCVMVGSCNFLFTQFNRFEASILVYDEIFVKYFIDIAANICCGKSDFSSSVRKELRSISDNILGDVEKPNIPNDQKLELSLVSKNQHQNYIDLATQATDRVYIISDYINTTPIRPIFDVLKNCKANKYYYYCQKSSYIQQSEIIEIGNYLKSVDSSSQLGAHHSKSHAKVLAWDNNHLLITSLNWLSGMVSDKPLEKYHEIGVYVQGWDVGKEFINIFREL